MKKIPESESWFMLSHYYPSLQLVRKAGEPEPSPVQTFPIEKNSAQRLKRGVDIILSTLIVLVVLSWLIPLLAIGVYLDSGRPIFFIQQRVGFKNQLFKCYKLKTMYIPTGNKDQHISRWGKWLRIMKLDELPQFINVLKGEMSIVGPRPHMISDDLKFEEMIGPQYQLRHLTKPGITGLAQINGFEGRIDDQEKLFGRIGKDLYYLKHWTIGLDLIIIWQTAKDLFKLKWLRK